MEILQGTGQITDIDVAAVEMYHDSDEEQDAHGDVNRVDSDGVEMVQLEFHASTDNVDVDVSCV